MKMLKSIWNCVEFLFLFSFSIFVFLVTFIFTIIFRGKNGGGDEWGGRYNYD